MDLVRVCVQMQPGMAELFLCVRHTQVSHSMTGGRSLLPTHPMQGEYSLKKSSCLNAVLSIVKRQTEAKVIHAHSSTACCTPHKHTLT